MVSNFQRTDQMTRETPSKDTQIPHIGHVFGQRSALLITFVFLGELTGEPAFIH